MAQFPRAQFLFSDPTGIRWSETFWKTGTVNDLKAVQDKAVNLGRLRVKMLAADPALNSPGANLDAIRVSFDDVWRDSLIYTGFAGGSPYGGSPQEVEMVPWSVILLRLESTDIYRRSMYLAGVPRAVVVDPSGPDKQVVPLFWQTFGAWVKELQVNWGFKVISKDPGVAPEHPITGIKNPAGQNIIVITCPGLGAKVGDPVVVRGCKLQGQPSSVINGHWTISAVNGDDYTLFGSQGIVVPLKLGIAKLLIYQVVNITDVQTRGETHRKRGVRGFGAPLGRSRKKICPIILTPVA